VVQGDDHPQQLDTLLRACADVAVPSDIEVVFRRLGEGLQSSIEWAETKAVAAEARRSLSTLRKKHEAAETSLHDLTAAFDARSRKLAEVQSALFDLEAERRHRFEETAALTRMLEEARTEAARTGVLERQLEEAQAEAEIQRAKVEAETQTRAEAEARIEAERRHRFEETAAAVRLIGGVVLQVARRPVPMPHAETPTLAQTAFVVDEKPRWFEANFAGAPSLDLEGVVLIDAPDSTAKLSVLVRWTDTEGKTQIAPAGYGAASKRFPEFRMVKVAPVDYGRFALQIPAGGMARAEIGFAVLSGKACGLVALLGIHPVGGFSPKAVLEPTSGAKAALLPSKAKPEPRAEKRFIKVMRTWISAVWRLGKLRPWLREWPRL
jgi:hypothetical protein